jgi:hypothetical protein
MNLSEIFEQIEGPRFDATMNAASGLSVFQRALERDETLAQLRDEARKSAAHSQLVFQRLTSLLEADNSALHCQRFDAALAAYLYALNGVDFELAQEAIDAILQTPNLFWARRLAKHIREQATIP